ncbi:MAG: NAD(P)-binding protein [Bdellovibrionales bacterium]
MSMVYDYIVIGSGLSGLTIATALSQETSKVLLLDSADQAGGWLRKLHMPFVPATPSAQSAVLNLESLLNLKILGEVRDSNPVTYENSSLKTFMGFGEKSPEFYDEISYYCATQSYDLKLSPSEWITLLLERFKGTFQPRSIVTKFVVENGRVQSLLVNGTKKVVGHNFIFCGEMKSLEILLPIDFMSSKVRNKIAKTKTWTRASLQLTHAGPVTDNQDFHILIGTAADEIVTCVGRFANQVSTWTTFISDDEAEDPEITAQALKRIKRQIKRAYPDSLNAPLEEKIVVQSEFGGHFDVKLQANQTWPEIENLWIGSAPLQKDRNIVGALRQAWLVLASLGFSVSPTLSFETPEHSSADLEMAAEVSEKKEAEL